MTEDVVAQAEKRLKLVKKERGIASVLETRKKECEGQKEGLHKDVRMRSCNTHKSRSWWRVGVEERGPTV